MTWAVRSLKYKFVLFIWLIPLATEIGPLSHPTPRILDVSSSLYDFQAPMYYTIQTYINPLAQLHPACNSWRFQLSTCNKL
jgi:hypothetical protein